MLTAALVCAWVAIPMAMRLARILQMIEISGYTTEQMKTRMNDKEKRELLFMAAKPFSLVGASVILFFWSLL